MDELMNKKTIRAAIIEDELPAARLLQGIGHCRRQIVRLGVLQGEMDFILGKGAE